MIALLSYTYNCLLAQPALTFTMTGGTAPYTCTLVSPANVTVATGSAATVNGTVNVALAGFYTVYFNDAMGCAFTTQISISVAYTSANISFITTSVTCNGGSTGSVTTTPPNSFSSPVSYTWSPGGYNTAAVSNLTAGLYSVTAVDNKGCMVTNTVQIVEPPPIVSAFANTFVPCFGSSITSSIISTGNVGTTNYTVNGTPLAAATVTLMAGIHTLITQDSKGCTITNTLLIDQEIQPQLGFTINQPSCPGMADGSVNSIISNAPQPYSYTWQPTGSNSAGLTNIPSGNYTLSLLDGNGCLTKSITAVLPAVSATVTAVTKPENCSAADGAFTLNVTGVNPPFTFTTLPVGPHPTNIVSNLSSGSYTTIINYNTTCIDTLRFSIGNLSPVSVAIQNSLAIKCYSTCTGSVLLSVQNAVPPITYSATGMPAGSSNLMSNFCAGFYVIKVVDASGCPATTTVNFDSPPVFSYSATAPSAACAGNQVSLLASASGGSGGYTYVWNPGNITGQVVSITPAGTTVYSLNAYDSNGCTQAPVQVTVNVQPQIAVNINSSNSGICPGTTAQITPTVSGGDGNYNYLWLPGNSTSASIFVENATVPVYTFVVNDGCGSPTVTKLISINLFPVTQPLYQAARKKGCEPFCTSFINATPGSYNAIWNYGDKPFEQAGDTTAYCYRKAGIYDLLLSVTDSNNCRASFRYEKAIEVLSSPRVDFVTIPSPVTLKNAENVQIKNITTNGFSYRWYKEGKALAETENIFYTFPDTGCYKFMLIAENQNFCSDTLEKYICVEEGFNFYMPNCFTPNGSGLNDTLIPRGTGWLSKNYLFEVYNRWGTRLFKTTNITAGWDGSNSGADTPFNSFIWRVVITDTQEIEHVFEGPVTVLR